MGRLHAVPGGRDAGRCARHTQGELLCWFLCMARWLASTDAGMAAWRALEGGECGRATDLAFLVSGGGCLCMLQAWEQGSHAHGLPMPD